MGEMLGEHTAAVFPCKTGFMLLLLGLLSVLGPGSTRNRRDLPFENLALRQQRTVLRWMHQAPRNPEPAKPWAALLSNHRQAIAAMDLFTVPSLTFGVLNCFLVVAHDRQRILHWDVTRHPASMWVVQQLREAFQR